MPSVVVFMNEAESTDSMIAAARLGRTLCTELGATLYAACAPSTDESLLTLIGRAGVDKILLTDRDPMSVAKKFPPAIAFCGSEKIAAPICAVANTASHSLGDLQRVEGEWWVGEKPLVAVTPIVFVVDAPLDSAWFGTGQDEDAERLLLPKEEA